MRATASGQSALLLLDVLEVLNQEGVECLVLGAVAAAVHGVVRATVDADAVAFAPVSSARRLAARLDGDPWHATVSLGGVDDPIGAVVSVGDVHENRVDLLFGLRGLGRGALERAVKCTFRGETLVVLGREDFIATKVYSGGPLDLADARDVLASAAGAVDLARLREITAGYGRAATERLEALLGDRRS
jgi:hypothetical protein